MKDVIILGKGDTKTQCPFDADEIWGINDAGQQFKDKKFDKIFMFDPWTTEFIAEQKKIAPIVSWQPYADIPYPLEEIIEKYGSEYFSNTVSYMLAYAMYLGIPRVRIYGIDAAAFGTQYALEKGGIEYWIGRLEQAGIIVEKPEGSHICRTVSGEMYGSEREGYVLMYLRERLAVLNLLPRKAFFKEAVKINTARFRFEVKDFEGKEHDIKVKKEPDGTVTYVYPKEFLSIIWMPKEVWDYVADILKAIEARGELPTDSMTISAFEKLALYGEYEKAIEREELDKRRVAT